MKENNNYVLECVALSKKIKFMTGQEDNDNWLKENIPNFMTISWKEISEILQRRLQELPVRPAAGDAGKE